MSTLQGNLASDEDGSTGEKSEPLVRVEVELQPKRSDHDLTVTVRNLYLACYVSTSTRFHFCRSPSAPAYYLFRLSGYQWDRFILYQILCYIEFILFDFCESSAYYGMMRMAAIVNCWWVFAQVVLQPVEFVYSDTLIKRASSFFSFPTSQEVLNDQV